MAKNMIVWIDHQLAQVVDLDHGGASSVFIIESGMERRHRASGAQGVPPPGHVGGDTEYTQANRRRLELGRFLARVKRALRGADGIVVLGPGLAKTELHRVLCEDQRMRGAVAGVMPAPRLTAAQMVSRARPTLEARRTPGRLRLITPRRSLRGLRT